MWLGKIPSPRRKTPSPRNAGNAGMPCSARDESIMLFGLSPVWLRVIASTVAGDSTRRPSSAPLSRSASPKRRMSRAVEKVAPPEGSSVDSTTAASRAARNW